MAVIPLTRISRFWGFEKKLKLIQKVGSRTFVLGSAGFMYVLKTYPADKSVPTHNDLLNSLKNTIPVSLPVANRDGLTTVTIGSSTYSLFTFIRGTGADTDIENATPEMAQEFGRLIGRLHTRLALCDSTALKRDNILRTLTTSTFPTVFSSKGLYKINWAAIENFFKDFFKLYYALPVQCIHGDLHAGNIIVEHSNVAGIIDFDYLTKEVKVMDLAYLILSVLAEFYRLGSPSLTLYLIPHLLEGYCEENQLTIQERESLVYLLVALSLNQIHCFLSNDHREEASFATSLLEWTFLNREKLIEKTGIVYAYSK